MIKLDLDLILDKPTRDALSLLVKSLNSLVILQGKWEAIDVNIVGNQSLFVVPHNLKFTPKDMIITHQKSTGTITVNYDDFNPSRITLSVSGAGATETSELRAYLGKHKEV